MFYNCKSLTTIDLSNFDTSSTTDMRSLFYNCSNLEYINIKNFTDKKVQYMTDMFTGIAKNAVICVDENKAPSIYNLANNMPCVTISCVEDWRKVQNKINEETGECIINCNTTPLRYQYKGKCYDVCPINTTPYNNICYSNDDLCSSNCKTCYFEDNIPISSICSSCNENKFLKNGKCVDNCENGFYLDKYDSSIKICKCDITKCEICTSESLSNNNLCISCNNDKEYYPIINDLKNIGNFIECYKGNISGYYLDNKDKNYKKCYDTCEFCDEK